jgi:EAL domain-containing protein (putative c-di-GMP-specific phosphodiesterase class I)
MRLEHQLRAALDQGQLCLHYQPQIDAAKGQLIGVEGLVRWIHPERGMVAPRDFIPLAEEAGLIGRLGEWVLREACRQKRTWERAGLGEFPVAVNVSFKQLRSGDLADVVASALAESRLDPRHLELEITENLIMDDLAGALSCLRRIERMGVRIAIDDFGTGYSSLGVLDKLPAHTLKIDQAFVRGIARDPARAAITRTMVAIAQELGMQTLAEGVETEEEMNLLGELGVTRMQGYLFDHPLPAEQFEETWGQDPESDVRLRDG